MWAHNSVWSERSYGTVRIQQVPYTEKHQDYKEDRDKRGVRGSIQNTREIQKHTRIERARGDTELEKHRRGELNFQQNIAESQNHTEWSRRIGRELTEEATPHARNPNTNRATGYEQKT